MGASHTSRVSPAESSVPGTVPSLEEGEALIQLSPAIDSQLSATAPPTSPLQDSDIKVGDYKLREQMKQRTSSERTPRQPIGSIPLEKILTDIYLSHKLISFLKMEQRNRKPEVHLYLNCLNFWMEADDYMYLPASEFRIRRAQEIFDKYFNRTTPDSFPVEELEKEELVTNLYAEMPSDTIYNYFKGQVFAILTESVYPSFATFCQTEGLEKLSLAEGYEERKRVFKDITLRARPDACSPQRVKLEEILQNSKLIFYLKKYLTRTGYLEVLMFYLEAAEFSSMFSEIEKQVKSESSIQKQEPNLDGKDFFLTSCSKIYDKFLRQGASMQVTLSSTIVKNILDRLSSWDEKKHFPFDLFDESSDSSFTFMAENVVNPFLESTEYQEYLASNEKSKKHRRSLAFNPETMKMARHTVTEILSNPTLSKLFTDSMDNKMNRVLCQFYQEIHEFKAIPITRKEFLMGKARKIYMKYLQRGSTLELPLDPEIKREIGIKLGSPDTCNSFLFDPLIKNLIIVLEKEEYIPFILSEGYLHFIQNSEHLNDTFKTIDELESPIPFGDILENSELSRYFKQYLHSQFFDNCILCYYDLLDYIRIPKSSLMTQRARKIYQRYLSKTAKQPVQVSEAALEKVEQCLESKEPNPRMFQLCQEEIFEMMKVELFPSFLLSELGQNMIDAAKKQLMGAASEAAPFCRQTSIHRHYSQTSSTLVIDTVRDMLENRLCFNYFRLYCTEQNRQPLVLFWVEAEEYREIPDIGFMKVKSRKIYNKYLSKSAKQPVELKDGLLREIEENLPTPGPSLFLKAQKSVEDYFQKELMEGFKKSQQYAFAASSICSFQEYMTSLK